MRRALPYLPSSPPVTTERQNRVIAYVGLGANLGDPAAQILAATAALDELPDVEVTGRSAMYRSSPWGVLDQPDFVNAVIQVRTLLSAPELLQALLLLERNAGRRRSGRQWGPRLLDLDLLTYGETVLAADDLTLPHPRIAERNFVLKPLLDLDETLVLQGIGKVSELLEAVGHEGLAVLDEPRSEQVLQPRIVVEGPPFAGTRTLTFALAQHLETRAVVDDADNPFASITQRPSDTEQLAAQLHAMFRRQQKLERLRQADLFAGPQILGFLPERSSVLAGALLPLREQALFQQVEQCLSMPVVRPELVIYLQVSPSVAMHRQRTGNSMTTQYTEAMLESICSHYMQMFYQYSHSSVLTVNADHGLWSSDRPGWVELVSKIESIQAGKHYFNPVAQAI